MPLWIDPAWEYWQPDAEVAELLAEAGRLPNLAFLSVSDLRLGVRGATAIRISRSPTPPTRLAPERRPERYELTQAGYARRCLTCRVFFTPLCHTTRYCSLSCRPRGPGGKRRLPESLPCAHCGGPFRPEESGQTLCSRLCRNRAVAQGRCKQAASVEERPGVCPECGVGIEPPTNRRGVVKRFCSPRCQKRHGSRESDRRRARMVGKGSE